MPGSSTANTILSGNFRSDHDISSTELRSLLRLASQMRMNRRQFSDRLKGKYISLLFEKPSLRTRFTFELAIKQLGGDSVTHVGSIDEREPVKDVARNLARWTDAIVARTFLQSTVDDLATWSQKPTVNALSDVYHPCQALADAMTIQQYFPGQAPKVAFVGDGNNVANSLLLTLTRLGMQVAVACPKTYRPPDFVIQDACRYAEESGGDVMITENPMQAVSGARVIYTDVWTSMGQESEKEERLKTFAPFQVNLQMMNYADPEAIFLHCLPAKRGQEVTDGVMESKQSAVFDQAENRLHAQKALLLMLLG
jgi:ornithine carbamoyltransferase